MIGLLLVLLIGAGAGAAELNQIVHQVHHEYDETNVCNNETERITIVGTASGLLHAIDSVTHEVIWSLSTGGPLVSAHQCDLIQREYSVIPLQNGDLVYHGSKGVRTTSISARVFTENCPFRSHDGLLYTGQKQTRILEIDLDTGELLRDFGSAQMIRSQAALSSNTFIIGRTDFIIRAFDDVTGQEQFNLTYGEIVPMESIAGVRSRTSTPVHTRPHAGNTFCQTPPCRSGSDETSVEDNQCVRNAVEMAEGCGVGRTRRFRRRIGPPSNRTAQALGHPTLLSTPDGYAALTYSNGFTSSPLMLDSPATIAFTVVSNRSHATMARSQVDRRATDTHTENFENSLGTVTSLQSVDRCDSSRTSGKCGIETLQPARNAHRGEALSPIHLKCPHAQELRVASIDVLYGRSMPQCNDTMSDRTHFNGVVALGTQSVKSTGVSVFIRQKAECDICTQIYLDSEPSEDGSALVPLESYLQRTPRPLIDRTNGNYVYIKSTPEGGSYAVEVARQDFSPLVRLQFASDVDISRRGANVIASANECFRQEFCERSGDPEEVDVDVSLCPLNGSVASQTKAKVHPWFGYDMIQVTGVQYQVAAVQEALLRGNDVLEISLCGMRLLCALLFAAIRAAALAVGAAIALVSMMRCWGWGGERGALVRRMLQRLVAVVEDHPVDMSPSAAVSPTLHDERVVTIQSLSESDEVEASKRLAHLVIFEKEELGRGSNGTVVLKGMLEGKRQVAVKKMLSRFQNTIDREIAILSKVDDPNVVRYFQSYRSGDFHFLVLELCHMSLWDYVMHKRRLTAARQHSEPSDDDSASEDDHIRIALLQVTRGLDYLHDHKILHRDIKPHNILLRRKDFTLTASSLQSSPPSMRLTTDLGGSGEVSECLPLDIYELKISDMGLSREHQDEEGSLACSSHSQLSASCGSSLRSGGTIGWGAPELYKFRSACATEDCAVSVAPKDYFAVDVFSLGCVFYFVMVPGEHPFGNADIRLSNIKNGIFEVSKLRRVGEEALDLVSRMIHADPLRRPRAHQIKVHPYFWDSDVKLDFLNEFSDRIQLSIKIKDPLHAAVNAATASNGRPLVGVSWEQNLHPVLLADISQHRKYDFQSTSECLRMIRNKRRHINEIDENLRHLSSAPRFFRYFNGLFPELLMRCVRIACRVLPDDDALVKKYLAGGLVELFRADSEDESDMAAAAVTSLTTEVNETGEKKSNTAEVGASPTPDRVSKGSKKASGNGVGNPVKFKTEMCRNKEKCQFWKSGKCHFAHTKEEQALARSGQLRERASGGGSALSSWRQQK